MHTHTHTLVHTTCCAPSLTTAMLPDSLVEMTDQRLCRPSNGVPAVVRLENVKTSWCVAPFLI